MNDYIAEGFHKLDDHLVDSRPPKIKWGKKYQSWSLERKLEHAEKLACAMNHAAYLIQQERDALNELCEKKEQQLMKMNEAVRKNNEMLQQGISRLNEQKQGYHDHIANLNAKIKELECGNQR